jgi:hypothetical protein
LDDPVLGAALAPALRAKESHALAVHRRVARPKHGAIAVVRVLAAVEHVNRPVVGSGEEAVIPFVAEQLVGACAAAPEPVRPAAPVEESFSEPPQSLSGPSSPLRVSLPLWPNRKSRPH